MSRGNVELKYAYFDYEIDAVNKARNIRDGHNGGIISSDEIIAFQLPPFRPEEGAIHFQDNIFGEAIKDKAFQSLIADPGLHQQIKFLFPYRLKDRWHWNAAEIVFVKTKDGDWQFEALLYDPKGIIQNIDGEIAKAIQTKFCEVFPDLDITQKIIEEIEFESGQKGGVACGMYVAFMMHKLKTQNFSNQAELEDKKDGIWSGLVPTDEGQRAVDIGLVKKYCPDLSEKFGKIDESNFVDENTYLPKNGDAKGNNGNTGSFDKENYDDSTDEETSAKILKQKPEEFKRKLIKKGDTAKVQEQKQKQKELVLLALHQEGLKILYSQAVNDVYYGKEGLKHRFLAPSDDKKVYDRFKKDLREVLREVMKDIGNYIIDDEEKINKKDLNLLIDSIFSQDKELGGFDSYIDSFVEKLRQNNGYHKLSSLKRQSSSSSRVSGSGDDEKHIKDFSEELEGFLKEFIKFVDIKAHAKNFTFTFGSSQNEKHKDLIKIQKNASKAIKEVAKKLSARTILPRSFETGDIKNSAEFLSYVRLFNRSQNRQIRNLQDKNSEPLYSTQIIDHRLIKFAQQYEASESHNITYNEDAKKFGRSDEVERMGAYSFIKDCIEDLKKNIRSIYKVTLSDATIATWIRSCFNGKEINLNIKDISHEHREEILTLISGTTYLIFGTETARNPASLITQQMMLDMLIDPNARIQDSNGNLRRYNFQDFFGHKEKKKKGQDAVVIQGLMPMSPPGATAAARILNEKYSKFSEGEFKFNYKYPGPHKSGVKNPISADELEDLEYDFIKRWLQLKLGAAFKETNIYEQFQAEIEKAKLQWYSQDSKDLSTIVEEDLADDMKKSVIDEKKKTAAKSSHYLKPTESSKAKQVTPDSSPYDSPSTSPKKSLKKFGAEKENPQKKR